MSYLKIFAAWFMRLFREVGSTQPVPVPRLPEVEEEKREDVLVLRTEEPEEPFSFQLTPNFHLDEFACKDGTPVPSINYDLVKSLANNLEVLRRALGDKPITIISGYRTASYNKKIGGAPKSQHLKAMAADIKVKGYSSARLTLKIKELIDNKQMSKGGLAPYPTFTHYDIRGKNVRWKGTRKSS